MSPSGGTPVVVAGLGAMGLALAARLQGAGFHVTGWDPQPARLGLLAQRVLQAAVVGDEAALQDALGRTGLVVSAVTDDAALSVLVRRHLLPHLPAGGVHLCFGTLGVATARDLATAHAAAGQRFVACPVFGRPDEAWAGDLTAVWGPDGSEADALADARRAVAAFAPRVHEVAGPEAAAAMKLAGNLLIASAIATMTEGFGLAARHGVPPALAQRIVTGKLLRGPVYEGVGRAVAAAFEATPSHPSGEAAPASAGFTVNLGLKDLQLAAQAAGAVALPTPLLDAVRARLAQAVNRGGGARDWSQLPLL